MYLDEDKHGDTKSAYEIKLKCGSKIALDLAGAQWDMQDGNGPYRTVTYWTDYRFRWIHAIKYRIPFRSHALKHATKICSYRMVSSQTLIMEMVLYFNILMASGCKAELGFHPCELLEMDSAAYCNAKGAFLNKVKEYLQKRPKDLDSGRPRNILDEFDLRHPKVIADAPKIQPKSSRSLPLDLGDISNFDWKTFSRLIQQPSSQVSLREKKLAKDLQRTRSAYKEPGSWQLVFLEDTLPSRNVPTACVSENPNWKFE